MTRSVFIFLWIGLSLCGLAAAEVSGRVVTASGVAIDHARIEVRGRALVVFADGEGRFALAGSEPPVTIEVSHPRFHTVSREVVTDEAVEIVLEAKQGIYEEIVISADRGGGGFSPVSVAASVIDPLDSPVVPSTLTELIVEAPGVSENGQGGLFQAYSVRGVSRQRVLTLVDGMRIVGERRAGVSASFVDPYLMGSVEVLRGPSSTYYGSGALGGVVQLLPRRFDGWSGQLSYNGQGGANQQAIGWGDEVWSFGLARRAQNNSEAADDSERNDAFSQISATARRAWSSDTRSYELLMIGSTGRDIGKASTDFPERTTIYPEENHLLLKFGMSVADRWRLEVFAHDNDLETEVVEVAESRNTVFNEATDFGLSWTGNRLWRSGGGSRFGFDYFGRRGVDSRETDVALVGDRPDFSQVTLDGGRVDEAGTFAAVQWDWGAATLVAGARGTWQHQSNSGEDGRNDSAASGFVGLVVPLGAGFELAANAGSGLRFPTLSERFFSGTTGRGEVIGNPDLDPERSINLDLGMRWYGERLFVSGYLFRNRIDDYIERIEVADDLLTFVNLSSGRIVGVELEGHFRISPIWNVNFGGHLLDGEEDGGTPLADIPADRFFLGVAYSRDRWGGRLRWEQRAAKNDPGSGEKSIPGAGLLSASLSYAWIQGLDLRLEGRNLLDEEYFNSADRKVQLTAGRSLGVGLSWSRR